VSNYDNAPNIGIVGLLLSNGANVGITDSLGNTLLHSVLRVTNNEDRMALFALLVKHGANINARNKNGDTMLHSAIENNHLNNNLPLINLIRTQFGALVDLGLRNNRGLTPIEYAQYLNATDIVYELQRPFPVLGLSGDVNAYDSNGLTPVMLAVIDNNKALVQTLIRDYLPMIHFTTQCCTLLYFSKI
jgi:ankyrin repeat protein